MASQALWPWYSGLHKRSSWGSDISCRVGGRPVWLLNLVQRPVLDSHFDWICADFLKGSLCNCQFSPVFIQVQKEIFRVVVGLLANPLDWLFLFILQLPVLGSLEQLANHFKDFVLTCFRWLETLRLLRAMKPRSKEVPWKFTPNTFSRLICQGYFPLVFCDNFCRTWKSEEPFSTNEHSHAVLKLFGCTTHAGSGVVEKASQLLGIDPEVGTWSGVTRCGSLLLLLFPPGAPEHDSRPTQESWPRGFASHEVVMICRHGWGDSGDFTWSPSKRYIY